MATPIPGVNDGRAFEIYARNYSRDFGESACVSSLLFLPVEYQRSLIL